MTTARTDRIPTALPLAITLAVSLSLCACGRQSETNDPDVPLAAGDQTAQAPASKSNDETNQPFCNEGWFQWVQQQVTAGYSEAIAEQYPTGLPSVGTDAWFLAVDKLTGGDGAHGPDGGSDEWCYMMQQRLANLTRESD